MNLQERKEFASKLIELKRQNPCCRCRGDGMVEDSWPEYDSYSYTYCNRCRGTGIDLTTPDPELQEVKAPAADFNIFSELSQYFNKED